jgi:hypothetical protein
MALCVVELAFSVHLALFPLSAVAVADLILKTIFCATFGPVELAITVESTLGKIAAVLRAVCKLKVTFPMLSIVMPETSISRLISVDLNSVTVSQNLKLCLNVIRDQREISDHKPPTVL